MKTLLLDVTGGRDGRATARFVRLSRRRPADGRDPTSGRRPLTVVLPESAGDVTANAGGPVLPWRDTDGRAHSSTADEVFALAAAGRHGFALVHGRRS